MCRSAYDPGWAGVAVWDFRWVVFLQIIVCQGVCLSSNLGHKVSVSFPSALRPFIPVLIFQQKR